MKQYKVNLNIITSIDINEDEVCSLIDDIIYYVDDRIIDNNRLWILDFELDQKDSIEVQTKTIISHMVKCKVDEFIHKNIKILLDIQIYYDTYSCSFMLPPDFFNLLTSMGEDIGVNFSMYPTSFDLD